MLLTRHADRHDRAHQAGTLNVVREASIHTIPTARPGRAVMMMNGSSHDWKFTTISR